MYKELLSASITHYIKSTLFVFLPNLLEGLPRDLKVQQCGCIAYFGCLIIWFHQQRALPHL